MIQTQALASSAERQSIDVGWTMARGAPDGPEGLEGLPQEGWVPAAVPGTVAGALATDPGDADAADWWYRVAFEADPAAEGEEVVCRFEGLATVAEVYLNGHQLLASESMFAVHEVDVGPHLSAANELVIRFRAMAPRLAQRRRPRARWRTRLVSDGNLRFYRTMLLGRAPGFAPGPPVIGPWRPVVLARRQGLALDAPRLRAEVTHGDGVLRCTGRLRALGGTPLPERLSVSLRHGTQEHSAELAVVPEADGTARVTGSVRVPGCRLWWPHTHGEPALYEVAISAPAQVLHSARVGFRELRAAPDIAADGPRLQVNGVPVFARGAVWTPLDLRAPHAPADRLRQALELVRAAGMNMIRVPGIATYESAEFYDLCDELGILVWQDFMFANLDYPEQSPEFMATVEDEVRQVLDELGARPSLAVLCGGSEVAQQVAMLGLDPGLAEGPLYGELLPRLVAEAEVGAPYVPSTPWGGDLPFRPDRGVANYYGVGAYLRPLTDARLAEVKFAAECLAFANVPDAEALTDLAGAGSPLVHHPAWKAGVPRDTGAGWDFDDVRDHYLQELFGLDPLALRFTDPDRYLELSRAVSGEVMAEVFGEWRRAASPCQGALVLWLGDLRPGAGWGVLDHRREPKTAYHHLRRALAPVAVWMTDEGLGGIAVHVANDRPEPVRARLRVGLYRDLEQLVDEAVELVEIEPRAQIARNVETMLGRFVDAAWAYRFGPPAQDLVVATLEPDDGERDDPLSQAFRFPAGRPTAARSAPALGLAAEFRPAPPDAADAPEERSVVVTSSALAYGVRITVPGYRPSDDAFSVAPGGRRVIALRATAAPTDAETGFVTALNLTGRIPIGRAGVA